MKCIWYCPISKTLGDSDIDVLRTILLALGNECIRGHKLASAFAYIAAEFPRYRGAIETCTDRAFDVRFGSEVFGHMPVDM